MSNYNLNSVTKNNVTSTLLTSLFGCFSDDVIAKSISSYMTSISEKANNFIAGVAEAAVSDQDISDYADKFFSFEYSQPSEWPGEEVRRLCSVNVQEYLSALRSGDSSVICHINDMDDEYDDEIDLEIITDSMMASNTSLSLLSDLTNYLANASEDVAARIAGASALFQSKYAVNHEALSNVYTRVVSMLSNPVNSNFQCITQMFYDITPAGVKDGVIRNNNTFIDFTCDFSEYTGVNPYAAWAASLSIPDLGAFFNNVMATIIGTTKNFAVQAIKWIQDTSYKFAKWWQKTIMGETEVWASIQGVEPSINTGGVQVRLSYPLSDDTRNSYPNLWAKLEEHANQPESVLCLPVLGATCYAWAVTTPSGGYRYFVAMRKHVYDNAHEVYKAIVAPGNRLVDIANKIESIGGIRPAFAEYNSKWNNPVTALNQYIADKLLSTERLISFGLLLASQKTDNDFIYNRYYQDADTSIVAKYSNMWINHPDNINTWTPRVMNALSPGSNWKYGDDSLPDVTNTFAVEEACNWNPDSSYRDERWMLFLSALDNAVSGTATGWIPYFWVNQPLTGMISVKTTKQQVEELKDLWSDGVKAIAVVGATVVSLAVYKRLRNAAFVARRNADLLMFDQSVDWRTALKANKKANLLAKLTGGAAVAIQSAIPDAFLNDQQTDINSIRTLITG